MSAKVWSKIAQIKGISFRGRKISWLTCNLICNHKDQGNKFEYIAKVGEYSSM